MWTWQPFAWRNVRPIGALERTWSVPCSRQPSLASRGPELASAFGADRYDVEPDGRVVLRREGGLVRLRTSVVPLAPGKVRVVARVIATERHRRLQVATVLVLELFVVILGALRAELPMDGLSAAATFLAGFLPGVVLWVVVAVFLFTRLAHWLVLRAQFGASARLVKALGRAPALRGEAGPYRAVGEGGEEGEPKTAEEEIERRA